MPGIVGIISQGPAAKRKAQLSRMLGRMCHQSFYTSGSHDEEQLGLSAGWVCHEGSFSDCLPVWNDRKTVCLIFVGENFADRNKASDLVGSRYSCDFESAQYLVHAYEHNDVDFLKQLNGTFCGLLVDLQAGKILLFNDRYGLGRVYYHEAPEGLYFSSEAKSLLEVLPHLRELDSESLGEFFACGCTMQNRSLFKGVFLLPPSSAWVIEGTAALRRGRYFDESTWERQSRLSASDYYEKLEATFERVLPLYFQGRAGAALSLTGGLDSRMMIARASMAPFTLPCYTFGGLYRECADVRVARRVAKVCQQKHTVLSMDRRFFDEFSTLANQCVYASDGTMDVVGTAGLFMHREARTLAPVRLTGNYGDEILRGNVAFKCGGLDGGMFDSEFGALLQRAVEVYEQERQMVRASFIAFKQVPWHHYGRLAMEQSQLTVRTPFLDNELVALAYQAPLETDVNRELAHRLIVEGCSALAGMPTDRGGIRRLKVLPVGLREFLQEFLPRAEYAYDYGMPQWMARIDQRLRYFHFERLFLGRQKYAHFRVWYRDELSQYVQEVLLDPRSLSRPYLRKQRVEDMVRAHVKGSGNYTLEISKLLTTELIHRELVELT